MLSFGAVEINLKQRFFPTKMAWRPAFVFKWPFSNPFRPTSEVLVKKYE